MGCYWKLFTLNRYFNLRVKVMKKNNLLNRIGAWITLITLTLVSIVVVSIIYSILSLIVDQTGTLPTFIASVIFYLYWPILIMCIFLPALKLINWASDCSESICPTRKGNRYKFFIVWYLIVFVLNIISLLLGTTFTPRMLFPIIYLLAFWDNYSDYKSLL